MTRGRVAAALAALAVSLCAGTGTAAAAPGMEVAISDEYAIVDRKFGDLDQAMRAAKALNATRMRILVQWSRVSDGDEPVPAAHRRYGWETIDDAVDLAARHGMRTMLTLTGPAPAYGAEGTYKDLRIVNPDPERFAEFARAAAAHFAGRVDRYGIWNEPNYPGWLQPHGQSAAIYRRLYAAAYDAIKGADPQAQVLIGETVPYGGIHRVGRKRKRLGLAIAPLKWMRDVLCVDKRYRKRRCQGLKADGFAHHPYDLSLGLPPKGDFPGRDNAPIQELDRLRAGLRHFARLGALTNARGRPLDIHLTESGYFTAGKRALRGSLRSRYLADQFDVAARTPGVRSMLQYNLYVPDNTPFNTGLFLGDGTPLPEWSSLLRWSQQAVRKQRIKRNTGPIELPPRRVER